MQKITPLAIYENDKKKKKKYIYIDPFIYQRVQKSLKKV